MGSFMKKILLLVILTLSTQFYAQSLLDNGISLYNQEKYSAAKEIFESVLKKMMAMQKHIST
jgi:hypothetical protein